MKIPVYNQQVIPKGESEEVFSLPGEKERVRNIPSTGLEAAKAKSRYADIMFDIGTKIEEARDADAVAEAQKQANAEYTSIMERFTNPKNLDPVMRDDKGEIVRDKNGVEMNNPNYIPPELYKKEYERMSKASRDRILNNFGGRPRAKRGVSRYLEDYHTRQSVKVNGLARTKIVADMTERLYKRMDDKLEAASVAYNQTGDMDNISRLYAESQADITSAVRSGILTPTQGKALQRSVEVKAADAIMKTDINKAYNHGLENRNTDAMDAIIEGLEKPKKDDILTENQRIDYKVMAERLRMGLEGKIERLNREEMEQFLSEAEKGLESAMVDYNSRNNLGAVRAFNMSFANRLQGYVDRGVMTEKQAEATRKNFQQRSVYGVELSNIYLAYQAGVDKNDPEEGIENIDELISRYEKPSKTDVMTENQRVDLLFKASAYKKRLENAQAEKDLLAQARAKDLIEQQIANYRQNGVALHDEAAIEKAVTEAYGTKNKRNEAIMHEYRKNTNEAKIVHRVSEDVKTAPLDEITSPGYIEDSVKDLSVEDRPKAMSAMATAVNNKVRHLQLDPVDYAWRNSEAVQAAKQQMEASNQVIAQGGTQEEIDVAYENTQKYFDEVLKVQKEQGVPEANRRVLTKTEAQSVVRLMTEGTAEDVINKVNRMEEELGDHYPTAYRDLQREKLPDGLQIVLSTTNPEHRNLQIEAIEAYKMDDKEFKIEREAKEDMDEALSSNPVLQKFRRSVIAQGGGGAESQRKINSLEAAIRKLGMYKSVKHNDTDNVRLYANQAVEEVIGAHYQFADGGYRVPDDISVEEVEKEADRLTNYFDTTLLHESYPYPVELGDKIRRRGVWINNKTDDGIDLVVDGIKIIDRDGEPIGLKFNDLYKYRDTLPEDEYLKMIEEFRGES